MLDLVTHLTSAAVIAAGVPNPAPIPVPGLAVPLTTIIGWGKWLIFFLGIIGLLICGGQMAIAATTAAPSPPHWSPWY